MTNLDHINAKLAEIYALVERPQSVSKPKQDTAGIYQLLCEIEKALKTEGR